ncbi:RNA 2'-phosphotransferase [Hoeflea sp. TYP-13]
MGNDTTRKSKLISLTLRHKPEIIGVELDGAGWVGVTELLSGLASAGVTMSRPELEALVESSDKQRFALSEDRNLIRASQGHSVPVDLGLKAKKPPDTLFHGTAKKNLNSIMNSGLRRGRRHHVHLHEDPEVAYSVGRRHGNPTVVTVAASWMWGEGFVFYQSENNIWLTKAVPVKYIR